MKADIIKKPRDRVLLHIWDQLSEQVWGRLQPERWQVQDRVDSAVGKSVRDRLVSPTRRFQSLPPRKQKS